MKRGREAPGRGRFDMDAVRANVDSILDPSAVFGPEQEEVPSLRNPRMGGFGGEQEWPFFFWKAVYVQGYRAAIRRTLGDERRHHEWRHIAGLWLKVVDAVVQRQTEVHRASVELDIAEAKLAWLVDNLEDQVIGGVHTYGLVPRVPLSGLKRFH